MTRLDALRGAVGDFLHHDEIGLAYGRFSGHVLRSAYQPAYRLQGGRLTIVGARALVRPSRDRRPAAPARFLARLGAAEKVVFSCVCRALHVANLPHLDLETATLALRLDPLPAVMVEPALALLREAAGELEEEGFDAPRIWCEFPACETSGEIADAVRAHGFRVAICDVGPQPDAIGLMLAAAPDYVRLDGDWFRSVSRMPEALTLLARLTTLLHAQGVEVMADGIEATAHFEAALEIGADLFQGYLFAPPFLAGSAFTQRPLRLPELLRPHAKIIPLRRPA